MKRVSRCAAAAWQCKAVRLARGWGSPGFSADFAQDGGNPGAVFRHQRNGLAVGLEPLGANPRRDRAILGGREVRQLQNMEVVRPEFVEETDFHVHAAATGSQVFGEVSADVRRDVRSQVFLRQDAGGCSKVWPISVRSRNGAQESIWPPTVGNI